MFKYPISWSLGVLIFTSVSGANAADALNPSVHIRTLAASCAACHGTHGNSQNITPSLAGLAPSYFTSEMLAFKQNLRPSTVMHHHAKGLNVEEINLLAEHFANQPRTKPIVLKNQSLKALDDE